MTKTNNYINEEEIFLKIIASFVVEFYCTNPRDSKSKACDNILESVRKMFPDIEKKIVNKIFRKCLIYIPQY